MSVSWILMLCKYLRYETNIVGYWIQEGKKVSINMNIKEHKAQINDSLTLQNETKRKEWKLQYKTSSFQEWASHAV